MIQTREELVAFRSVLKIQSDCDPSEVTIPPKLSWFLALELERRAQAFARADTKEIFSLHIS